MDRKTRQASADAINRWVGHYGRLSLLVSIYNPDMIPSNLEWFYAQKAEVNEKSIEIYGAHGTSIQHSGYQFSILPQFLETVTWDMRDEAKQRKFNQALEKFFDNSDMQVEQLELF